MVELGWRLDLMILEVFSDLWIYDSMKLMGLLAPTTDVGNEKMSLHRMSSQSFVEFFDEYA